MVVVVENPAVGVLLDLVVRHQGLMWLNPPVPPRPSPGILHQKPLRIRAN